MHRFANPARFLRLAALIQPWTAVATLLLIGAGLYFGLMASPADYQQGNTVRIMYVHVPSAWLGMAAYSTMAMASAVALVWKHPLADLIAKSAAPIGAAFTLVCLVTGSLWGKPMWGTWWVWDARLTSMLILFFLYLGYMALGNAFDDPTRGAKASAVLALAGFVNVPVIKFSVDWWNTLHQPASVSKIGMPSIDPAMLLPLMLMALGFTTFFVTLLLMQVRSEILAAKIRAIRLSQIHAIPGVATPGEVVG
jgi:heme exporter protein C